MSSPILIAIVIVAAIAILLVCQKKPESKKAPTSSPVEEKKVEQSSKSSVADEKKHVQATVEEKKVEQPSKSSMTDEEIYAQAIRFLSEKKYSEAVPLITQVANKGYAVAQNNLALMYLNGIGVQKDIAKAESLLRQAAGQGHADAMHNLKLLEQQKTQLRNAPRCISTELLSSPFEKTCLHVYEVDGKIAKVEVVKQLVGMSIPGGDELVLSIFQPEDIKRLTDAVYTTSASLLSSRLTDRFRHEGPYAVTELKGFLREHGVGFQRGIV